METPHNNAGNNDPEQQPGANSTTSGELLLRQSVTALGLAIVGAITAGRKTGETNSVLDGESFTFEVPDDGTEVFVSRYGNIGGQKYADELAVKYGFDIGDAIVEAYVGVEAEYEGPELEYGVYLLSDGRTVGFAKLFANPIRTLNGPVGAEARRLANRIGLEEQWMKFERNANYHNIMYPTSAVSRGYAEPVTFELTTAQVDSINGYIAAHQTPET